MFASNVPSPAPLTDDSASDPLGRLRARQIRFAVNPHQPRMAGASPGSPSQTSTSADSTSAFGALDPDRFHHISVAQSGRVGQHDRHAAERQRHVDMSRVVPGTQ